MGNAFAVKTQRNTNLTQLSLITEMKRTHDDKQRQFLLLLDI